MAGAPRNSFAPSLRRTGSARKSRSFPKSRMRNSRSCTRIACSRFIRASMKAGGCPSQKAWREEKSVCRRTPRQCGRRAAIWPYTSIPTAMTNSQRGALYKVVGELLENPDLIVEREERIRNEFVLRPWSRVAQDYLEAAAQPGKTQLKRKCYVSVVPGKEYILRKIPSSFEGYFGEELRKSIENAYFGPILSGSVGVQDAIDGLSLRGD